MLQGKRVLLIIGGGIAAYKSLELIRRLKERGATVRCVLTEAAQHFVTPLAAASLSGDRAYTDLFNLRDEAEMGHIELSRDADLVVVAPATADLMAKFAGGHADDLASTLLLATDKRVLLAPAMNVQMWLKPATRRNVERLRADGAAFVGPNVGAMAEAETGPGRMAEPPEIVAAVEKFLADARALEGRRVLVTSGPTHEPIDPVRYIANRSSGRQGHAIAAAAALAGADVTLVSGPVSIPDPFAVRVIRVETAQEMLDACGTALPADVAVCAAAVADWRVAEAGPRKIKKKAGANAPTLRLVENPDILATLSRHPLQRPRLVIGFAAETHDVTAYAQAKLRTKGCDWIVANDVSPGTGIMGGTRNQVRIVSREGVESWPEMSKEAVAERLVQRIAAALEDPALGGAA